MIKVEFLKWGVAIRGVADGFLNDAKLAIRYLASRDRVVRMDSASNGFGSTIWPIVRRFLCVGPHASAV